MIEDPDFELVRRCRVEDPDVYEDAFRQLYERYGERVYNTALRILGSDAEAADATQDVFLTLFRKVGEFQFESKFFTWLFRITVNVAIDRRRRRRKTAGRIESFVEDGPGPEDLPDPNVVTEDERAEAEHLEVLVERSLARLSPKLRAVVVLRYVEGLSYEELAQVLECSLGTVKSRLNRAHRQLEGLLGPALERERRPEG